MLHRKSHKARMIRIRNVKDFKEVYEMQPNSLVQAIDGPRFLATGEIERIGEPRPLSDTRVFDVIEVHTGFEDGKEEKSIMFVAPRETCGYQDTLMQLILY